MARRALPPSVVSPPLFRLEPNPLLFVGVQLMFEYRCVRSYIFMDYR